MEDLVAWLIHIEHLAGSFYRNAANACRGNEQLAGFLGRLADEEAWHGRIMENIADYLEKNRNVLSDIALDEAAKNRIETPFRESVGGGGPGPPGSKRIIDCVVAAEFSEWNDIFVYVMNTVKEAGKDFAFTASKMQAHKRHIERFLEGFPEGRESLQAMRRLPSVWQPRILVVEDYEGVREFLSAVLSAEGVVDTAENGKEALERTEQRYYDLIVSDMDMPVMNGIEFYDAASVTDPLLADRFLVLTGNPTDRIAEFIGKHGLRYLRKPMQLQDLTGAVKGLLEKHSIGNQPKRPAGE